MKQTMLAAMVLAIGLCAAGDLGAAEGADQERPQRPDFRPLSERGPGQFRGQWGRGERMGAATQPSDEEVKEIEAFMGKHSPRRYDRFKELPEARREGLMRFLAARYRMLEEMEQNDPEVYQIRIARMGIEDQIFDLGWQLNHDSPENSEELTKKLRQQLRAMVKSTIEERRLRVKQWKKRAEEELASIEKNESNIDHIVEANVTDVLNDRFPGMGSLMGLGGPGGPGGGQGMGPGMGPGGGQGMGPGGGQGGGRGNMRPERDRPDRDRPGPAPFAAPTRPADQ